MATATLFGVNWDEVNQRLKRHWGLLTDHDLSQADGNIGRLVGIIERKTGRSPEEIERFVHQTIDAATSAGGKVAAAFQSGFQTAGRSIQRRPMEMIGAAIGAGLLLGVAVGCMFQRNR